MKILVQITLMAGILGIFPGTGVFAAEQTIQARIDMAPEGGSVKLEPGIYREPIVLKKAITLEGKSGVVFHVCSSKPVIRMNGNNITVRGIQIESCSTHKSTPAIEISGRHNAVEKITIVSGNN